MLWLAALAAAASVAGPNPSLLRLHSELVDVLGDGPIGFCNFLTCWDRSGEVSVVKDLSARFQCLIGVNQRGWVSTDRRQVSFIDMACPASRDYLSQVSDSGLLRLSHVWFISQSKENMTMSDDGTWRGLNVSINSGVFLVDKHPAQPGRYIVRGVYKGAGYSEELTDWTVDGGFPGNASLRRPWALRRGDLMGKALRVALVATSRQTLENPDDLLDTHIDSISKLGNFLITLIVRMLNGTIEYRIADYWGSRLANGSFDGMVGFIARGESDVSGTQLFPNDERLQILHFIATPVSTTVKFVFMSPPLSFGRNIFTLPFSRNVWIACIATILIFLPVLYYVLGYEAKAANGEPFPWSEVVMMNVATVCQQGSHSCKPVGHAGRILTITLLAATIFVYVSYSAYIMVLLQTTDKSIKSLEDLVESNFQLAALNVSYNRFYVQTASERVRKKIAVKILKGGEDGGFLSVEEGAERIRSRLYAFLTEPSPVYKIMRKTFREEESCGLQELQEAYFSDILPMWGVRKNYTYTEMIRIKFRKLQERGHVDRVTSRLYMRKRRCSRQHSSYVSVGLADIRTSFVLLFAGFGVAVGLLLVEIVVSRKLLGTERPGPVVPEFVE